MDINEIPEIDLKEFQDFGFLLEANRQFFHPLGLALFARCDDNGIPFELGCYDCRDDEEGFGYNEFVSGDVAKSGRVQDLKKSKEEKRLKLLGSIIQEIELKEMHQP